MHTPARAGCLVTTEVAIMNQPERERRHDADSRASALRFHDPFLQECWNDLAANGRRAQTHAASLTSPQLWERPAPGRWSAGECLDHLVLAGEAYLEVFDEALAETHDHDDRGPRPVSLNLFERVVVNGVEPPARIKIPAPKRIRPRRPASPRGAATAAQDDPPDPRVQFQELRRQYAARLQAADGRDLDAIRVRSPFVPLVRVSFPAAVRITIGHERRHLAQAADALATIGGS